jgi:hypothetical protein
VVGVARGGKLRVRGKVTNADKIGADLQRGERVLDDILERALFEIGQVSVGVLRLAAPRGDTGQLARGIKWRRRGDKGVDVTINAVNRQTGFDYAGVTRFGHQVEYIYPTEGRKALRINSRRIGISYRAYVHGVKVSHDWVDDAWPAITVDLDAVMKELGREVELRLFT